MTAPRPTTSSTSHWARRLLAWLWTHAPRGIRRFLAPRFRDVTRSEKWGYAVWTAMGVVIAVPEISAVGKGCEFGWPTISTTVGHLEDEAAIVALIPVVLIVMTAYSLYTVKPSRITVLGTTVEGEEGEEDEEPSAFSRTPHGRATKHELVAWEELERPAKMAPRRELPVRTYFLVAAAVVVGFTAVAEKVGDKFVAGYILYSLIAIFWVVIPSVFAYWRKRDVPFATLVFTVASLGRRLPLVAALVAALLTVLLLHLAFYPWPSEHDPTKTQDLCLWG